MGRLQNLSSLYSWGLGTSSPTPHLPLSRPSQPPQAVLPSSGPQQVVFSKTILGNDGILKPSNLGPDRCLSCWQGRGTAGRVAQVQTPVVPHGASEREQMGSPTASLAAAGHKAARHPYPKSHASELKFCHLLLRGDDQCVCVCDVCGGAGRPQSKARVPIS